MGTTTWRLLFSGNHSEAICALREEQEKCPSLAGDLGIAFLWIRDYQAAATFFDDVLEREPIRIVTPYILGGVAKWCMGDRLRAAESWRKGCDCDYSDAAGGVEARLLILFNAILSRDPQALKDAERILSILAEEKQIQFWPGPIAEYCIGYISEEILLKRALDGTKLNRQLQLWQANFYAGVVALRQGNNQRFHDLMKKTAIVSRRELASNWETLYDKLLGAEFFLARHESQHV
jgi:lipoprotein NlpI